MKNLYMDDDTTVSTQEEVMLQYYEELMEKRDNNLHHIDIETMKAGTQLSMDQRDFLIRPVSEHEIYKALNGINDLKSPGLDGFGARFFKSIWNIVKDDLVAAVMEFFFLGKRDYIELSTALWFLSSPKEMMLNTRWITNHYLFVPLCTKSFLKC